MIAGVSIVAIAGIVFRKEIKRIIKGRQGAGEG